jgi:DnaK suppressor protein
MHYHYFTLEQREALERAIRAGMATRPELGNALQRLRSPDFGVCMRCGTDIPYVRLAENPAATHCRSCST